MMYWLSMTPEEYADYRQTVEETEQRKLLLDRRTVDAVAPGEQQPEADHLMKQENSSTGYFENEAWRDARDGGYFEYTLNTGGLKELTLLVRYWGNETTDPARAFDILVDGEVLVEENISGTGGTVKST